MYDPITSTPLLFKANSPAYVIKGIPNKGVLLTLCTRKWFQILSEAIPSLHTHFLTLDLPPQIPDDLRPVLQNRSVQVRKLMVVPIEAIVRGYLTGSEWIEYQKSGTVHGIKIAPGLKESERIPNGPIYTPSTKAPAGGHDENIHPDQGINSIVLPQCNSLIVFLFYSIQNRRRTICLNNSIPFPPDLQYRACLRPQAWRYHRRHQVRIRPRPRGQAHCAGG